MAYHCYFKLIKSTAYYSTPNPDPQYKRGTYSAGTVKKARLKDENDQYSYIYTAKISTGNNTNFYHFFQDDETGLYILYSQKYDTGNGTDFANVISNTTTNKDSQYFPTITRPATIVSNSQQQQQSNQQDDRTTETINNYRNSSAPIDSSRGASSGYGGVVEEGTFEVSDNFSTDINNMMGILTELNEYDSGRSYATASSNISQIKNVLGVFGLPYQFMPHVDPRVNQSVDNSGLEYIGVDYADKIVGSMPLLFLSPGKPSFMSGYSDDVEKTVLQRMLSQAAGNRTVSIDDLLSKNGKFYTFEYAVTEYYNYVNPMCRICAQLMGITDEQYSISGTTNDNIRWEQFTQGTIQGIADFATDYLAIPFYLDSETQISDNMSNDVTESSLASTVDGFSDMGRELMFYLGYTPQLAGFDNIVNADMGDNAALFSQYASSIKQDNIFKSLVNQLTAVATGGRIEFPKIWSSSSFSRSYDVTIKLRSPDMDPLSLWVNIIVPICHILGFTQPRMMANNPNAYTSPFLVRGMYKGFFNVDMGIISGCNISKGDDAQWSINGIPTTVDINLTITDLYDVMSITPGNGLNFDVLDNTAQMDYLMNLCGINIYKPEISRLLDLYYVNRLENKVMDVIPNIFGQLRETVSGAITNIYRGLL